MEVVALPTYLHDSVIIPPYSIHRHSCHLACQTQQVRTQGRESAVLPFPEPEEN